jgi:hypothetical protein
MILRPPGRRAATSPDGGSHGAGGFDGDAMLFCEGQERFAGFLGCKGQADGLSGEGLLVRPAEQE